MQRREGAGRIGIAGITRQRKGLAAAAAEIDFAEFAALARLRHPAGAAVAVEGFGVLPDPGDRMIGAHRFEFETGDALRRMARQNLPGRRDVEELPAPAAHALLRPQRIIVGHDIVDRQHAFEPNLCFLDDAAGLLDLLQGRHQRRAVLQRPAVILDVGDFQPVGIEIDCHPDDVGELVQVLPVHDGIHRQRQIELARPFRGRDLPLVRVLQSGDAVGDDRLVALEADLHVTESGAGQCREFFFGKQHRRGDQVGVKPGVGGMLHQLHQVLARGRLAAGEMDLQHADLGKLGEHLLPFLGRKLAPGAVELHRIGAIGALQRAAVGEFGKHGERNAERLGGRARFQRRQPVGARLLDIGGRCGHGVFSRASVKKPLSARSCSMAMTSAAIASRGAV